MATETSMQAMSPLAHHYFRILRLRSFAEQMYRQLNGWQICRCGATRMSGDVDWLPHQTGCLAPQLERVAGELEKMTMAVQVQCAGRFDVDMPQAVAAMLGAR